MTRNDSPISQETDDAGFFRRADGMASVPPAPGSTESQASDEAEPTQAPARQVFGAGTQPEAVESQEGHTEVERTDHSHAGTAEPAHVARPADEADGAEVGGVGEPDGAGLGGEDSVGESSAGANMDAVPAPGHENDQQGLDAEGAPADSPSTGSFPGPPGFMVLSTGCGALDDLLDGGLESDAVTLVFGEGGSGKTNLALQCSRAATAEGRVAFVDTEGVSPRRLSQVLQGCTPDQVRRLHFFKPLDLEQQSRMVEQATKLPDLKLIVLDSINMHYRLHMDSEDERKASRQLYRQLHGLTAFARSHEVPVLVTGQVYGDEDQTHPFARRLMEHLVKASVRFEKRPDGLRRATIVKHRSIEEGRRARFRITETGLAGESPSNGGPRA